MVPLGKVLEDKVKDSLCLVSGYRNATTKEDREKGADWYYYGQPFDITLDFQRKVQCHWSDMVLDLSSCRLAVGMRVGNQYGGFEVPTLVIYVEPKVPLNKEGMYVLSKEFNKEVLDGCLDVYYSLQDSLEEAI